ncbi:hypothetical protein M5K25_003940 [Dendrobium thyrsiflorum]|uniref:Uncharacterized protein n=1 Tax=Dendrobium thyrsiflorum TaxID=117978 RepID=A0ABD0VKK0_DENTH
MQKEGFGFVYQRKRFRGVSLEEITRQEDIMTERDEGQSSQPIRISEDPENVAPVGGSAPSIDPTPVGMNDMNVMSGNMMQLQMMNMMMQMMEKMQSMGGSAAPGVPPVVTPVTPTTPGSSINVETGDPKRNSEEIRVLVTSVLGKEIPGFMQKEGFGFVYQRKRFRGVSLEEITRQEGKGKEKIDAN